MLEPDALKGASPVLRGAGRSNAPGLPGDAIRLARLLAAGELTLVRIPSIEREQLRDLVRCREDIRVDLMRARNRIGKFLLRREIYWEGPGEAWSRKHRSWLTSVRFADHASQATLADYLHAHDVLIARRDQVEAELAKLALSAPCAHTVARLRCLRGIDTLSALGLCAEIGEWERFDHPDQLASYLGIVPSEHTSGAQRRLGSITKAGSTHARRLLVEAAYHDRRGPAVGEAPGRRQRGQAPEIINISWRTQRRLHARWRQLKDARRKPSGIVAVTGRPRTRRLLLGDRHLHSPSRPGSAGIPADGRPPHARSLRPAQAHTNDPQETHQLTLTLPHNLLRLARRPEPPRLAHTNSAISRLSTRPPGGRARLQTADVRRTKVLGQPPNMSITNRREPGGRPDRPASRNHINHAPPTRPWPSTPTP